MDAHKLLEITSETIRRTATDRGLNLVAYSGGVDSTLATVVVHRLFPLHTIAVLGVSASVSRTQLEQARNLANKLGFPLEEVTTEEGTLPAYVENTGLSCYHCKQTLYKALEQLGATLLRRRDRTRAPVVLFNGTNRDDLEDPTRVGLAAAREHGVISPLAHLTKEEVRILSRHLGIPNWHVAASPCLRSRLQYGVVATRENLARVEAAEAEVRRLLDLNPEDNLRVRHLAGDVARVELDPPRLPRLEQRFPDVQDALGRLGFKDVTSRPFRSGSLSFLV